MPFLNSMWRVVGMSLSSSSLSIYCISLWPSMVVMGCYSEDL